MSMATKAELRAMEKVFAAEVENRLPFQSNAAIYKRLRDQGMLETMERSWKDRFGVIIVTGYQLSHAGRFTYCSSC